MVFDKTGTLTLGEPEVLEHLSFDSSKTQDDIFFLSASLDQLSVHVLANSRLHSKYLAQWLFPAG